MERNKKKYTEREETQSLMKKEGKEEQKYELERQMTGRRRRLTQDKKKGTKGDGINMEGRRDGWSSER